MKDLKFTPGPWAFEGEQPDGNENVWIGYDGMPICLVRGLEDCECNFEDEAEEETSRCEFRDNALLIAKAPEMYEALKQAKEALQKAENTIHRLYTYADMLPEDKSGWLKELRQALETINKLGI